MKLFGSLLLLLCSVSFAMKDTKSKPEDRRMQKFLEAEWEYVMKESPESATAVGFPGQDDRWTDMSREAIERRRKRTPETLKRLRTIKKSALSAEQRLNYDLFESELLLDIEGNQFPSEYLQVSPMGGPQSAVAETMDSVPTAKPADFENALLRLERAPVLLGQLTALLKEGAAKGITPPRITLRNVDSQIAAQLEPDPEKNPMLEPFRKISPDFPQDKAAAFKERAARVLKEKLIPAYAKFRAFFKDEYYPKTRETIGLSELPNGRAWYAYAAKRNTTTELTPEQIHQIGLDEVKRIRAEMEAVRKEAGFKGDLKAYFEFLRTDDQFFFDTPEDLLVAYRDIAKRADHELPRLFGTLPRLPYGVLPVPSYSEQSSTTAYYRPGSPASGRAGAYFANTYNLKARPKWEMQALSLHEAVPGHHLQIALAQEDEGLPDFRKHGGYTAYVEGWGLYAESLGDLMGFYKNPHDRMGKLIYEIWRAIRLVVDTGMHSFGWSRDKAIQYFAENSGKAEHDVVVEVDRYISWPGQALAYKIGELKLKELRSRAKQRLGDKFDIRHFHDAILGDGALPLGVLEKRMEAWISGRG
jgi:uncharacterized protein (DUF885 family)